METKRTYVFKKIIGILIAFSFFPLLIHYYNTAETFAEHIQACRRPNEIYNKWENQLPNEHWLKNKLKNEPEGDLLATSILSKMKGSNILIRTIDTTMDKSSVFKLLWNFFQAKEEKKYYLCDECGIKVENWTIKIKQNNIKRLTLMHDKTMLYFALDKEIFLNNSNKYDISKIPEQLVNFVPSYIENTNIAVFCDGELKGLQPGKTKLYFSVNGYEFMYNIIVNP